MRRDWDDHSRNKKWDGTDKHLAYSKIRSLLGTVKSKIRTFLGFHHPKPPKNLSFLILNPQFHLISLYTLLFDPMAANTCSNVNKTHDTLYDLRKTHVSRVCQPPGSGPAKSAKSA